MGYENEEDGGSDDCEYIYDDEEEEEEAEEDGDGDDSEEDEQDGAELILHARLPSSHANAMPTEREKAPIFSFPAASSSATR